MDATDKRSEEDKQFIERLLTKKDYRKKIASMLKSGTLDNKSSIIKELKDELEKFGDDSKYAFKKRDTIKLLKMVEEIEEETNGSNDQYSIEKDKERIKQLDEKYKECKKHCDALQKELKSLYDLEIRKETIEFSLSPNKTLIDLLIERILDDSSEWKTKINTLINIPTSTKGENILRGGDYFEALFQLAIAINIIPQFSEKYIKFYDRLLVDNSVFYKKQAVINFKTSF
jgi:hypothetical protein